MGLISLTPLKSSAFSPASIAGLRLWLDASDTSKINSGSPVDGDLVDTWTDKSSNAYSFTASGGTRPTFKTNIQNGLPIIRSSASVMQGTPGADMTAYSAFIVTKVTTFRQYDAIIGSNTVTNNQQTIELGLTSRADVWFANIGGNPYMATASGSIVAGNWYIMNVTYTQSTPAGVFYLANASSGTTSQGSGFLETSNMTLFDDAVVGFTAYRGDTGEIIIYDSVLGTTDRTNVYNYLKAKWGL